MGIVFSVYNQRAFCDFLLPAITNEDFKIVLKKGIFEIRKDISLHFENIGNIWRLNKTDEYQFLDNHTEIGYRVLSDGVFNLRTQRGEEFSCIIRETEQYFSVFEKYDISQETEITIGSEDANQIKYQYMSRVSGHHAVIKKAGRGFAIQNMSSNGLFVNAIRVDGNKPLHFGDCINIYGLKIIYLGDCIAVGAVENTEFYVSTNLKNKLLQETRLTDELSETSEEKKYFHRAPRNYVHFEEEDIEIEAPPAPKLVSKKPLWMVIGPSFTMILPMLAGSVLALMSTRASGGTASTFMYTGIITAAGSAIIGAFWALANIRYNKKEVEKAEALRIELYGQYLDEREELICAKYDKYIKNLAGMYPEAAIVVEYGKENAELWNRNYKHGDFLSPRLGLGNLPFPVKINIPKERFSLQTDELADKAKIIKEKYSVMKNVPVTLDFMQHRLLGIVGGTGKKGAIEIVKSISAQIAACNCYTDVKIVYVYDGSKETEEWTFARWLPHVWSEDRKTRFIAENKSQASDIFFELLQIFRIRAEESENRKSKVVKPYYILVISNPELLEDELITKYIYDNNPCYGLTTLLLAENEEDLPNECENILKNTEEFSGFYNLNQEETLSICYDKILKEQLERFARRILSIQVKETEVGRDIPNSLTFFEMYGISSLKELSVEENWRKNRTYENMKAIVGAKAGGVPCYLDVHEKYHGPHGLVAGTTGSGKSETLQTYLLSLALNFSPDDVGYFIIDYKGGGMAGLFDGLPHMIGAISNLSGSQVRRAMVSIKSENRRRQRIFSENNVNNINLYTKLYKSGEAKIPVPHMFIIVDEFAELKREEPEFMKELISVAQVGRSLGVHLILATQKPSGTVDDNIWSNSKFRLCLRVQDRQDSNDMLHKPDAAYITQAGRCYLQVGNDEVYELFQSGYSGAVYDTNLENVKTEVARMISLTGKASLIGSNLRRKQQEQIKLKWLVTLLKVVVDAANASGESLQSYVMNENRISLFYESIAKYQLEYDYTENNIRKVDNLIKATEIVLGEETAEITEEIAQNLILVSERLRLKLPEAKGKTQLDAVVEYLAKIAKKEGYNEQMKLWLQPLAENIFLQDIQEKHTEEIGWKKQNGKWNLSAIVGMCDDPENQAQFPLAINFSEGGHLAVCGSVVSGKSTFVQTLIFSLIQRYQPDWVNLYIMDFSSNMLNSFITAPHVGGIMQEDDIEKIDKFFFMIENIMENRKKLFNGGNYAQYVQANGVILTAIVVVLDNIGSFREKTEGKYDDKLLRLLKEGISYGIYIVVTAGGFSSSEINMKMGDNIKTVVCLQMNDKYAYSDALRKPHLDILPESNIKGRGLAVVGERVLEYHTALAVRAEDDFQRMEKIKHIGEMMSEYWTGNKAKQIPMIPEQPIWSEYEQLPDVISMNRDAKMIPVGYDMRSAEIYGINMEKMFAYLISGKNGTGKTNMQKAIMRSVAAKSGRIIVIEHTSAELKQTAKAVGAEYISNTVEQAEFFGKLVEPFRARNKKKNSLIEEGKSDTEIFEIMQKEEPIYFFVDDITAFIQSMDGDGIGTQILDIRPFVESIAQKGKLHNIFFFFGVDQTTVGKVSGTKILEGFIGARKGVHFGGAAEGVSYLDFSHMSYAEKNKVLKPGIGLISMANGDETAKVVIPLVKG